MIPNELERIERTHFETFSNGCMGWVFSFPLIFPFPKRIAEHKLVTVWTKYDGDRREWKKIETFVYLLKIRVVTFDFIAVKWEDAVNCRSFLIWGQYVFFLFQDDHRGEDIVKPLALQQLWRMELTEVGIYKSYTYLNCSNETFF